MTVATASHLRAMCENFRLAPCSQRVEGRGKRVEGRGIYRTSLVVCGGFPNLNRRVPIREAAHRLTFGERR